MAAAMTTTTAAVAQTRLDRLITLLESGSTPAIRATAARQLGQIAAVRVRGESVSTTGSGARTAQSSDGSVEGQAGAVKEEVLEQELEEREADRKQPSERLASDQSATQAVEGSGGQSLYRGVEGDWDQAVFLIARALPHLRSKTWDTRVAAAQAIEAICAAAGVWDPDVQVPQAALASSDAPALPTTSSNPEAMLTFDTFSLPHVLSTGKKLLSSAGNEYDLPAFTSVEERLAHAKRDMQRLGLGSMAGVDVDLGVDMEKELLGGDGAVENGNGVAKQANPAANATEEASRLSSPSVGSIPAPAEDADLSKLSARERNQLKRKRKMESKTGMPTEANKTRVLEEASKPGLPPTPGITIKTPSGSTSATANANGGAGDYLVAGSAKSVLAPGTPRASFDASSPAPVASLSDAASLVVPRDQWPFTLICALLLSDLFSPTWEVRHGAALGLRELFKLQGAAGGKVLGPSEQIKTEDGQALLSNAQRHAQWSDDAAIRLLCVLTLDRLGDFVFDQVIAPVRETAGQALASLLKWMDDGSALDVHAALVEMTKQDFLVDEVSRATLASKALSARRGVPGYAWEVRHAGLLGLRYEVSVRKDLLERNVTDDSRDILHDVAHLAIICLRDDDDDVRSVAAATLLPIVDQVVERMSEMVPGLLEQLWSSLGFLKDDLSSSTGGVMDLLAKLVEKPKVVKEHLESNSDVSELIPRLYPFFRHTITSVRLAVLNALRSFLSAPSLPKGWIDDRLVRLIFQNLVVEERPAIRDVSVAVWQRTLAIVVERGQVENSIGPHVHRFFSILMTPLGTPIDFSLFFRASSGITSRETHNVDKSILAQDLALVGVDTVIRGRLGAAQALGAVLASWPEEAEQTTFAHLLPEYLVSSSALQKCLASVVIQEWAERVTERTDESFDLVKTSPLASHVSVKLIDILESPAPPTYAEMVVILQRIQRQSQGLYAAFTRDGKVKKDRVPTLPSTVDPTGQSRDAFTLDMAKGVVGAGYEGLMAHISSKVKEAARPTLDDRRAKLIAEIGFYQSIKDKQDSQVAASAAAATIALRALPSKLNPVIRSIMNSIKFEENVDLQRRSARAVASLIDLCQRPGARANPSEKIVKNLCAFVCQDTTQTPIFERSKDRQEGIYSLAEAEAAEAAQSTVGTGRGRSRTADHEITLLTEEEREGKNIRRGAEFALQEISYRFGKRLFVSLPVLWHSMTASLFDTYNDKAAEASEALDATGQAIIDCCTLVQVTVRNLEKSLQEQVLQLLPSLTLAIKSRFSVIRSIAAKTLAHLADCITQDVVLYIVQHVVPLLGNVASVTFRQGAMETIEHVVRMLDLKLLPYVIVLIVPVLGRMSDSDEAVRLVATNTFASLVKMVPLEAGLPDPPGFPDELMARRQEERQFLAQLLDGNKVEAYMIPVEINADLRKYQLDGVSWMAFLAKFQLHGVLCDDMGLGKTLQSICILASKHFERAKRFDETGSRDSHPLPSLIVCPPTLTGHWCHEIKQYATNLHPLLYSGHPIERARLQTLITSYDCVVASYDTVRNDIDALSRFDWLYCILDEGHVIKSAKTKTTKAVKMIRAQHRLILSGTPIQNNVLELWSLFDFLMPGFLGTEKQFMDRYGRPILASRDAKVTAREHERASLALEALHKQVLPFLLRRMKEDVLADLPPKIIQDISCELSEVQRQLYDDYMRQQNPDEFDDSTLQGGNPDQKQHVFQTLQYLRKLVCHPSMVFDKNKPRHREIEQALVRSGRALDDIENAPKLLALKQLLLDCGIGNGGNGGNESAGSAISALDEVTAGSVSQHRVLIFCQQRQMLNIIEKDLLRANMPSVTYARLDGSITSAEKRFSIVQRFNADPSIDVLLLTTSVGGLGLTLTGADTVIFVEHDWNPMKDMQAMDRAHRLGQKRVVNVYRLIAEDTLEERIMGLQRFKLNVAGNIVNQQNKGMDSMETDQILDLFDTGSGKQSDKAGADGDGGATSVKAKKGKGLSQKAILASLEGMGDTGDDYANMQEWSAE